MKKETTTATATACEGPPPIDPRLQALFNEYYANGRLKEFVVMLQALIGMANAAGEHSNELEEKRKKKEANKRLFTTLTAYLEHLTPEEWIRTLGYLNKPYDAWTKELKDNFPPYVVKNIETFDDKRMNGYVDKKDRQKYPFGMQFFKVLLDHNLIRIDASGTYPRYKMITEFLNRYCEQWDLYETKTKRAQIVRFTEDDIKGYLVSLVTPKRSRFTAVAKAFDVDELILAGYADYTPTKTPVEVA